jgi:hypothetical protein
MGALVDVPIQEIAQTTLKNQSAIDAVTAPASSKAPPQSNQPALGVPLLIILALAAFLL